MRPAPENAQRIYLRSGYDGDPLSFSVRWFVPAGFEAGGKSEVESTASGKAELASCLALLGVAAIAVMVGDVMDGTPVFDYKNCTPADAAEHVCREGQRARTIAYSQTVYVETTPEELYRRLRLWESARRRWGR
ncbi:MAG: hypothetical protein NEA02_05510 [Thermoanaerobaculia bacterium]|nr:hypothetical protein [Thermoanaerobaculia bacterium]